MEITKKSLETLTKEIEEREKSRILSFEEYLELVKSKPQRTLRNIFQLFQQMVKNYVGQGKSEYPEDPEHISFVEYDCSELFEKGVETPFFAGRFFANQFVRQIELMTFGVRQNRILAFEGSHGCGKSTFLNNLLQKFQEYTSTEEGKSFEIFWEIDSALFSEGKEDSPKIEVPCPSHDQPILILPKDYRREFLSQFLPESEIKERIFNQKEYQWLFKGEACIICNSLFRVLLEKLGSMEKTMSQIKVRTYRFDRRLGEGIVIFNPGDKPLMMPQPMMPQYYLIDQKIQDKLDQVFGPNRVKYVYSPLAKTNNGIYALMDIKDHNLERLWELHNVISEGIRRTGEIEERINSLFLALMNPEDRESIEKKEEKKSFLGRIQYIKIPYVLEPQVELKIYRTTLGKQIEFHFLPRVLENYARVIISSRMNTDCPALKEWIKDLSKYKKYCDKNGLLLRMDLYSEIISPWLSEEDIKNLTPSLKRKLLSQAEREGDKGFTGRESLQLFSDFFDRYRSNSRLINMNNVADYFQSKIEPEQRDKIPQNFIESLIDWYDYEVLNEVKEALYFYNEAKIAEDILHFLTAISYDLGTRARCQWTGKEVEVSIEFLKEVVTRITGQEKSDGALFSYTRDIQKKLIQLMSQGQDREIKETRLYQELFNSYVKNLKKEVLTPFVANKSFREAVKAYGTKEFETFDARLREHVTYMIKNLIDKFGYTEEGAKEICLYVIDKNLAQKFS